MVYITNHTMLSIFLTVSAITFTIGCFCLTYGYYLKNKSEKFTEHAFVENVPNTGKFRKDNKKEYEADEYRPIKTASE